MNNRFNDLKILIVEDEELLREVLVESFQMCGATVDQADGGIAAVKVLKDQKYDILMTDIRMPNGDGISLLREVRDMNLPHMKIFVCSAYNDLTERDIKELKISKMFNKPFDIELIIEQIDQNLKS